MSSSGVKPQVERKLRRVSEQLKALRDDLRVTEEHLAQLSDEEEDARIRALVSETPLAEKEHRKAARHAERLRTSRAKAIRKIADLEREQDDLLDRLTAST
jgi:chromosome segregation ATPase